MVPPGAWVTLRTGYSLPEAVPIGRAGMLLPRTAPWFACALLAALLVLPTVASAATAPTLVAPAAGATSFREGSSMTFEWTGALQGDPDAIDRSYFRVEVIKAAELPEGAQAEWTKLENFIPTEPGEQVTSTQAGVPSAGAYRWRVCAWGVVDDAIANEIEQLPGGCSVSRAFETSAAAGNDGTVGELKVEERTQVAGDVNTVYVTRPAPTAATPADQAPAGEQPPATPVEPEEPPVPVTFTRIDKLDFGTKGPALGLGSAVGGLRTTDDEPAAGAAAAAGDEPDALVAGKTAGREGISGAVMDGLSATLPLVPIPYWTLVLLLACLPIARMWRGSVLSMFDWADGTIDGTGGTDGLDDDLAPVRVANGLKVRSTTADGDAPAPTATPSFAPDRGRRAA